MEHSFIVGDFRLVLTYCIVIQCWWKLDCDQNLQKFLNFVPPTTTSKMCQRMASLQNCLKPSVFINIA